MQFKLILFRFDSKILRIIISDNGPLLHAGLFPNLTFSVTRFDILVKLNQINNSIKCKKKNGLIFFFLWVALQVSEAYYWSQDTQRKTKYVLPYRCRLKGIAILNNNMKYQQKCSHVFIVKLRLQSTYVTVQGYVKQ